MISQYTVLIKVLGLQDFSNLCRTCGCTLRKTSPIKLHVNKATRIFQPLFGDWPS